MKNHEKMILSASGWRKVFALSGDEEDTTKEISPEDSALMAAAAASFCLFLEEKGYAPDKGQFIAIGTDTRPTGPAIADQLLRYCIHKGYPVVFPGAVAAPELMAYARDDKTIGAFIYVTASHNPPGHNGLKFGLSDGGVIGGDDSSHLISLFKAICSDSSAMKRALETADGCPVQKLTAVKKGMINEKKKAYHCYFESLKGTVTSGKDEKEVARIFSLIRRSAETRPLGILGELNGSARTTSIDGEFLKEAGLLVRLEGTIPGNIEHRIVPEGESLEPAKKLLTSLRKEHPEYLIAYVPDNDGDRGNIVFAEKSGLCRALEAQEVFALSLLAELSYYRWLEEYRGDSSSPSEKKLAVAVNGPTSMRVDYIAEAFSADVFRAEVGEANVVNLARNLREKGYAVPILGEGSNGGNITHPSAVRDPLCTVFALAKLILIRDDLHCKGLFHRWLEATGQEHLYDEDFSLTDIIDTLPAFSTTSAYESRAVLKLGSFDHGRLKSAFEELFIQEWEQRRTELSREFGIESWEEHQYEGTEDRQGTGSLYRSGSETGGLKILFLDKDGKDTACIWMRGSGTEPVFRILADCRGRNPEQESYLLDWLRSMIEKAYGLIE
jgi:phosphoglucomutase